MDPLQFFFYFRSISETNHKFVIKEAERVFQPMFDPNTLKFEELNDDCFFKIVSYLDLIDIVNLGKSSTRLQSFAKLIYRKKTRFTFGNHDEDSTSNESNLKPILQALGSYIQSLVWNSMEQRHLQYLSQYCSNVTELSITGSWEEIPSTVYQRNSKLFIKLEKLRIKESAISDCALKTLASSNELKYLQLYGCRDITSKFFAEWKPSKLETLKVKGTNDDILLCKDIFAFVKKNKLMKFSYDDLGSLQICLSLPSIYLSTFEELDLNYEDLNDDKLKSLNFKGLKRLQHLGLNCYFESFSCCNELLMAVSQIPALTSLTISGIIIDDKTLRCLGSIKSLRKIRIDFFANKIGGLFHSSLYAHLPAITELSLYEDIEQYDRDATEKDDINSSICAMITSIRSLRYFASESTTWELLAMILQGQERTKRPSIEIGVTKPMFRNPKKVSGTLFIVNCCSLLIGITDSII